MVAFANEGLIDVEGDVGQGDGEDNDGENPFSDGKRDVSEVGSIGEVNPTALVVIEVLLGRNSRGCCR